MKDHKDHKTNHKQTFVCESVSFMFNNIIKVWSKIKHLLPSNRKNLDEMISDNRLYTIEYTHKRQKWVWRTQASSQLADVGAMWIL